MKRKEVDEKWIMFEIQQLRKKKKNFKGEFSVVISVKCP